MTMSNLYAEIVEERLEETGTNTGYYRLYPDKSGFIAEVEIRALERIGYEFIVIGKSDDNFYALFEKKEE